jgi:hypothetical protein
MWGEKETCNGSLGTVSDYGLKQVCSFGELTRVIQKVSTVLLLKKIE